VEAPPVDSVEAPPVDSVEAPPVDTVKAPPVDTVEAPPVDTVEAPPASNKQTSSPGALSDEVSNKLNLSFCATQNSGFASCKP